MDYLYATIKKREEKEKEIERKKYCWYEKMFKIIDKYKN